MDLEFFKDLYFRELDAKRDQDGRTGTQVGILTILGSVLVYCYQNSPDQPGLWLIAFYGAYFPAVATYVVALVQVMRAILGHGFERLPLPDELHNYHVQLEDYYYEEPNPEGTLETEFNDFLIRHMVTATVQNAQTNVSRSERSYSAMYWFAFTVVFALVASGIALLAPATPVEHNVKVHQVEVQELVLPSVPEEE